MGRLIGVFGGTFDPPHIGHRILAHEAVLELGLDRILWVVTGDPPHKPDQVISPARLRVEMVHLITDTEASFELSRVELDREPPHYAVDTLRLLRSQWPDSKLVYLMGGDSLMELPSVWHQPQEFVQEVDQLGVMRRSSMQIDLEWLSGQLPGVESKVHLFTTPRIEVSSSLIRQRARTGVEYKHFLTQDVGEFVARQELYRPR
jgi:nicotinate-nucleotide adenylyltransferase